MTASILANCTDFSGRRVYLTQRVANHIQERHREMAPFLARVCDVLSVPDFVYLRLRTDSYLFYKLDVLTGKLVNTYMVAIVRYNEVGEGEVRTVYPTTRPASGDELVHLRPARGR